MTLVIKEPKLLRKNTVEKSKLTMLKNFIKDRLKNLCKKSESKNNFKVHKTLDWALLFSRMEK